MLEIQTFLKLICLFLGLIAGSFLNALIYRLPRGRSILVGRSKCPGCDKIIPWHENLPLISFIFLRGKCSKCDFKIPWTYPMIELLMGVISILLAPASFMHTDLLNYLAMFMIACCFVTHFFIDLEHKILPNSVNLCLGLLLLGHSLIYRDWMHWLSGCMVGISIPLAVTWIFYLIRGQIGLGGGDIKLYGVLGLYLGPFLVIQNIFLSCFLGSIVGVLLILLRKMDKNNPMPFGPCIIIVACFQIYFPNSYHSLLNALLN